MSCAKQTYASLVAIPAQKTDRLDQPAFMRAIIAAIDAFQEALEMQRAAHKRYPFDGE
jgi:hypothetical protein